MWFSLPSRALSRRPMAVAIVVAIVVAGVLVAWPTRFVPGDPLPLPGSLSAAGQPALVKLISKAGVFGLQTLGYPSASDGEVLQVKQASIDLLQACGGLRLILASLAVTAAGAVLAQKPLWERIVLAASGVPIGLVCSVVRVVAGGVFLESIHAPTGQLLLYGLAGWTTLVLAFGLLLVERWMLSRILIEPPARDVVPVVPSGWQRFPNEIARTEN